MKLLVTTALIVFVGLLNDTIATKLTRPDAQQIMAKIHRVARSSVLRPADTAASRSTRSIEDDLGSFEAIAEACAKNGGPNAFSNAEEKIDAALTQLSNVDDYEVLAAAVRQMEEYDNFDPIVRYSCRKRSMIEKFTTTAAEAIKPCFDAETGDFVDILVNLMNTVTEYLCQENGNKISEFLLSDGLECLETKQVELEICATDIFGSSGANSNGVNEIDTAVADCTSMTAARNCIQTQMLKCPDPSNADFVVDLIDFFLNQLCDIAYTNPLITIL